VHQPVLLVLLRQPQSLLHPKPWMETTQCHTRKDSHLNPHQPQQSLGDGVLHCSLAARHNGMRHAHSPCLTIRLKLPGLPPHCQWRPCQAANCSMSPADAKGGARNSRVTCLMLDS